MSSKILAAIRKNKHRFAKTLYISHKLRKMRLLVAVNLFLLLGLMGCDRGNKGVSFSTIKFDCRYTSNPIDRYQPAFDTLQLFILRASPDLISFKETEFTGDCIKQIESTGYKFIPINMPNDSASVKFSPVAIKKTSFEFLASSYYIYKNDRLKPNKNMLSWYQLKNSESGHVFYFFMLQLQDSLNSRQSELIAFDLLKRIDEISSGVPVILMGNFNDSNTIVKNLLTNNWKNIYALSDAKSTNRNTNFLANDFLKIVSSYSSQKNDTLINREIVRFTFSKNNISRSISGKTIPE